MSRKILFFGNEKLATGVATKAQIFSGLLEAGYEIKALIISQKLDKPTQQLEIVRIAKDNHIEVKSYQNLKQSVDEIKSFGVDAAVLAAYGKIIPKEVLDLFKIGIINVHPSLLPRHRGPTPIESTILNAESETGVSIMHLEPEMDSGPIYAQGSIKLSGRETKQELADRLDLLGRKLVLGSMGDILDGHLTASPQASDGTTYDKLISKEDGQINWQDPWSKIDRMIRAYSIWPKARSRIIDKDVVITAAHFDNQQGKPGEPTVYNGCLAVYCHDGLVIIDQLVPAGSKLMSGSDFILGFGKQLTS